MAALVQSPRFAVERPRLQALRDAAALRSSASAKGSMVAHEWAVMSLELRTVLLLLAGIDDDLGGVARKSWNEYTPPEQAAIRFGARSIRRQLLGASALLRV